MRSAKLPRKSQSIQHHIHSDDARCTQGTSNSTAEQANRASPENSHCLLLHIPRQPTSMHGHTKRLDQRGITQGDMRWQLITALLRQTIVCCKSAVEGWCSRKPHVLAEIVAAAAAPFTRVTGDAGLERDAVAHCEVGDVFPVLDYYPS